MTTVAISRLRPRLSSGHRIEKIRKRHASHERQENGAEDHQEEDKDGKHADPEKHLPAQAGTAYMGLHPFILLSPHRHPASWR
jgi:hypothetical protein